MNKEEYKKYAEEHEDWAPGWDAIDECFEKLYPGQEPEHFGTNIISRAMMGGESISTDTVSTPPPTATNILLPMA